MEYEDQIINTLLNQEEGLGEAGIEEDLPIEEDLGEEGTPAVEEESEGEGEVEEDEEI